MAVWCYLVLWVALCFSSGSSNQLPVFTTDLYNIVLRESFEVGKQVFQLFGQDPEGSPVKYGIKGTDKFRVDPNTGEVYLIKPLDRETQDYITFEATLEEQNPDPSTNLIETQPGSVVVADENDNAPVFQNATYEVDVMEDTPVGSTILSNIEISDADSVGINLEVWCATLKQWPEACEIFGVEPTLSNVEMYLGSLVLKKPLNYSTKQFYQFKLHTFDGIHKSIAPVEVNVLDVQNRPPEFTGSLSAAVFEDVPVGTVVLRIKARDGDRARPNELLYELVTNPMDFFLLDRNTGDLKTARPLDREALKDPSSPLNLTVRVTELVNGTAQYTNYTSSTASVTVTIKDVNDEPPRFDKREYSVEIPESLTVGTPLPNLDMIVTDPDVGSNSTFSLRLSDDLGGAFVVEPQTATGSASVTLRLNSTLDYEDPNQRKFILEVIAQELFTPQRLSSKASVTVSLIDVNDNAPRFADEPYSVTVSETAKGGSWVSVISATDRDTGRFGTEGIVYEISGNGVELFRVDNQTGVISVAPCDTPGVAPCLDYESRKDYFLQYKATDDFGSGQSTVVPLHISVTDGNDNAPVCVTPVYKASIDEDAVKFEPDLKVQARDADASSDIRYSIVSPAVHPFFVDPVSGRMLIKPDAGPFNYTNGNRIEVMVRATDGLNNATCIVEISVRDVNNHAPVFDSNKYDADISEGAPVGTQVAAVQATDLDSGENSELKYAIQKGAYDAFIIDNVTGVVTVNSQLDYDKKNTYKIVIIATDGGMPSLTGTTELTVYVTNENNKPPAFTPIIQRAQVSADADVGTVVHQLKAFDPDVMDDSQLKYGVTAKTIGAVDKNGKEVSEEGIFSSWFTVHPNGSVVVTQKLDRSKAAVVTLPISVVDTSAPNVQQGDGELIITIVDVNRHAPVFSQPSYYEKIIEEEPVGTVLNTYSATDKESSISAIVIDPPSPYFKIDNISGTVVSTQRIDYESIDSINFTLVAYDSGVPQLSTQAMVFVEVLNANDEEPEFAATAYDATVDEHSVGGTRVVTVTAVDKDKDNYGIVRYSLSGDHASLFRMDEATGVVTVAEGAVIDRETTSDIWLRATATDLAPETVRKSTSVPVHIKVRDVNDNAPIFTQNVYKSTIAENLQLDPPAAILQVRAEDKDEGDNGKVLYRIVEQSVPGIFTVDPLNGIIYPARNVTGNMTYHLTVTATDQNGRGPFTDTAQIDISVTSVNKHSPVFVSPPADVRQLEIPENAAQTDFLVTTIKATDEDSGDNGRISYYLKVANQNVGETAEFSLNEDTGELRTKTFLDREHKPEYQLVIAAVDNGSPPHESLRLLTVVLADEDDNAPHFEQTTRHFTVRENLAPKIIVGMLKATDKDSGENGEVYYHILDGNQEGYFVVGKKNGVIKTNVSFDREKQSEYSFTVYASNSPIVEKPAEILNSIDNRTDGRTDIVHVTVTILDENDNEPKFQQAVYYAGVKHTARINEPILSVVAEDPDLGENGTLVYMVAASNLYKFGASVSSGSVVPSPFNISQDGVITTAQYMSEYNQDRFVLDIIAQEIATPHRQAKVQVYVWVIDRSSLIRMVVSRDCNAPVPVLSRIAKAGNALLVPGRRVPHVQADRRYDDWCEIHLHAVDPNTYQVLPVEKVLETIDSKYDELKDVYQQFGVETLIAASATSKAPDSFDPALAALIALLIVLFTGIVTFVVVCACLKHWVIPAPSMQSSKGDSLARRRILEELSTTENPLWLETKLRPYEEQELTMNVFGDQQEVNTDGPTSMTDNTYATIQGSRTIERFGDYATLGGDSPTPLEAAMGFQGSTFKPPSLNTPEPPPRPTAGLAQL